jgi:hypothetical protein
MCLTSLTLCADERLQVTHMAELATLTGLQSLVIRNRFITDASLQELTQLTGLTCLWIDTSQAGGNSKKGANGNRDGVYIESRSAQDVAAEVGCVGGAGKPGLLLWWTAGVTHNPVACQWQQGACNPARAARSDTSALCCVRVFCRVMWVVVSASSWQAFLRFLQAASGKEC